MLSFFYEQIIEGLNEQIKSGEALLRTVKKENLDKLQARVETLEGERNRISTLFFKLTRCEIDEKEGDYNTWQIHS